MPGYKKYPKKPTKKRSRTSTGVTKRAPRATAGLPVEVKFYDQALAAVGLPAGPASVIDSSICAGIINGSGPQNRVGRKIKVVQIDYSVNVTLNGTPSGPSVDIVQFDIFKDKQCNGAAATPAELYTAAATPGTCQMLNPFNEKRFSRIYTKSVLLNQTNSNGAANTPSNVALKFEGSIRPNCIVEYQASTAGVADVTTNNLFLAWSSDSGLSIISGVLTRVHYVDA